MQDSSTRTSTEQRAERFWHINEDWMTGPLYRPEGLSVGLETGVCIVPRCTELGIQVGWTSTRTRIG